MIKLLPEGIGVIPVYLNLTQGSREEYGNSYATYEGHIAYLASQKCNVIAIEGAAPFLLSGPTREAEMVEGWKRKYNTDMFSVAGATDAKRASKASRVSPRTNLSSLRRGRLRAGAFHDRESVHRMQGAGVA
jgi:hypothetical protein